MAIIKRSKGEAGTTIISGTHRTIRGTLLRHCCHDNERLKTNWCIVWKVVKIIPKDVAHI